MDDTEMANFFFAFDDEDKEENGESSVPNDANGDIYEDVDGKLMEDAADDVNDAHDDELINVYDKGNHVIAVGKLFPNMDEFRMYFKTYAFKHEFDAKTKWTDRKKFYARCRGLMEVSSLATGTYLLDANLMEVPLGSIKSHTNILVLQVYIKYQP
ncbi:hypothetical protein D1007_27641 [Hordeum vulgare]|nr:hypothetical protein D1007_27641 [Hordeum vulgare]